MKRLTDFALAAAVAMLVGCGGDTPTGNGGPVRLVISRAPGDAVASGSPLTPGPIVQLQDGSGQSVAQRGILVTASLASGTGTLGGVVEIRTDDAGQAAFDNLRITGAPAQIALRFSSTGLAAVTSAPIQLTAGTPAQIEIRTGSNQVTAAGTDVPVVPTARVLDQSGNPVAGVQVLATVAGGGSVGVPSMTTDASGIASVGRWTLGAVPGTNRLTFAIEDGPEVSLDALGVVGPPAKITVVAGNEQTAVAGQLVTTTPAVRVTDAFDNPIAGVTVTFTVSAGGGIITDPQPKSDANGLAKLGSWKLGPDAGPNTLQASRPGLTAAVFTATASPVPVAITAGNNQLAFAGGELRVPITIRLANGFGVPRADVTVSFVPQAGAGTIVPASAVTDSTGKATAVWTVGTGTGTVRAEISAPGAATSEATAEVVAFKMVSAGRVHACGLTTDGQAFCWGDNRFGQLGDSTFADRTVAVRVKTAILFDTLLAATTGQFTCGIATTGESYCWGSNNHGQSGDGTNTGVGGPNGVGRPFPTLVGGDHRFVQLSAGGDHVCGVIADGSAFCWGRNFSGELGDGNTTDVFSPKLVTGGLRFSTVSTGDAHTCGIQLNTSAAWCWGASANFRLGIAGNPPAQVPTPSAVQGGGTYSAIAGGALATCALTTTGIATCWGNNGSGQLGDGTLNSRGLPQPVSGSPTYTMIETGGSTVCGLAADGRASCWGENTQGEAGAGLFGDLATPALVAGNRTFLMISSGDEVTCALAAVTRAAYCWGPNTNGQVGDGTLTPRNVPTLVRF